MKRNITKRMMVIIADKAREDVRAGIPENHMTNTGKAIEVYLENLMGRPIQNARVGNCAYFRKAYSAAWFFAAYNELLKKPKYTGVR